ncbi:S49 family peptidase [Phaeovulum vinaykumarii]|uniref:Serine protease SohB n=1 Tax=Phaeovulum vinaykumarii TaxID=407234 RepID=A0A1N7JS82_9RHOB|nr:S49 family peptidase [Phaeovulum vinaykumarii]SIS52177.1 serine protease SohB [Phaeovulum vinaykumarii]SOB91113.1 serine protease SohB [Phaeovulum vinaykumarii]
MKLSLPSRKPSVAVIRLEGPILSGRAGTQQGLSDTGLGPVIERAFARKRHKAVALILNSPGGSPVQSALIAARIRRLADETGTPVHAFIEDVAASGGYWLACAADDIHADALSIVGSIGVISAGFGFPALIERWGIERRVHTAGKSKSFMDPFRPENPEDIARLRAILGPMHEGFIDHVKTRRGDRLATGRDLFTGDFWLGREAVELGLIDGIGHAEPRLKALYGDKVKFVRYGQKRGLLRRFGAQSRTADTARALVSAAEEHALWARYGL